MLKRNLPVLHGFLLGLFLMLSISEAKASIIRDVFIFSECEKMASIRVRNGVAPYTYVWSYGGTVIQTDTNVGESEFSTIEQAQGGDYTLNVTDAVGNTYSETINFSGSTNFILHIEYEENQQCEGETFGNVFGTIENGIAPFTVNFYNEANNLVLTQNLAGRNLDLNGIPAGRYLVEVIDATGCKELTEVEIEEVEPIEIAPAEGAGTFPETCVGNGGVAFDATAYEGEVRFRIRRANGTYETGWITATDGQIRYNELTAGDYVLEITDRYRLEDCPEEIVFNIANDVPIEVVPSTQPITCVGDTDGSIILDVNRLSMTFPFPPASVEVDILDAGGNVLVDSQTIPVGVTTGQQIFPGFGAGTYTILVRHGGDDYPLCTLEYQATVGAPNTPLTATVVTTPESCFGEEDGTARVNRSGGWGGYSYSWSDGQTGRTATGLAPGNYTVTVTDQGGCAITLNVTINGPDAAISAQTEVLSALSCVGADDGSARVFDIQGGWGSYTFLWSNGETTPTASSLPAGESTVTVRDAEGCETLFTVDVPVPDPPLVSYTPTAPTCFGGEDGSLAVEIADTSTDFTITLNGQTVTSNNHTFTGLPAGDHQIQIAYGTNCNIVESITIDTPEQIIIDETGLNITSILCHGDGNGAISGLQASGGTGTLNFQWQQLIGGEFENLSGQTGTSLSNLDGGSYRWVVTDQNGCQVYADFQLEEPGPLAVSPPTTVDVSCFGNADGSISFTLSGGTAPYAYALNGDTFVTTNETEISLSGLAAGNDQYIQIRDANGCAVPNINFDIASPPPITITDPEISPETCFGQGNGGISITIDGGSGNLGVEWFLASNMSNVISTDQNLTNRSPGNYAVRVYDLGNPSCFVQESFTIAPTPELQLSLDGPPVNVFCFGEETGAISLAISGGVGDYTFNWTGPNGFTSNLQNIEDVAAGLYNVRVTDENGCWKELTDILISQPSSGVEINVLNKVTPKCHDSLDGRIEIQVAGGNSPYQINWEIEDVPGVFQPVPGNGLTLSNITAGIYKALVRDANGCLVEEVIDLDGPEALHVELVERLDVSCFGRNDGRIGIEVTGGTGVYFYNWDHGFINKNPTNLGQGTYGVTVTDANGCSFRLDDIEIFQPDELSIDLVEIVPPSCTLDDASIEVTFTGAAPGQGSNRWIDVSTDEVIAENQTLVSGLQPGFYRVEYSAGSNCTVTKIFRVPGPANPLRLVTNAQDASCPGETGVIFLSATGGQPAYSYFIFKDGIWQPANSTVLAGLPAGDYSVRVEDSAGCQDESTLTIDQPNPPVYDAQVEQNVSCFGGNDGALQFSISGTSPGDNFQWYRRTATGGKAPIATADLGQLIVGTYFMELTFAGGCTIISPDYVITQPEAIFTSPIVTQPVCAEDRGSFSLEVIGGLPGKTIRLTGDNGYFLEFEGENVGAFSFADLNSGTYTWEVEDEGCPTQTGNFVIQDILQPQFNISTQDITCFGANDGILQVLNPVVQGGRTFTVWVNGVNQGGMRDFFNLAPGAYLVAIRDNQGCESPPQLVQINQPDRPLEVDFLEKGDVSCFQGNNGEISFSVLGGRPQYRATLTGNNGSLYHLSELDPGQHYLFAALRAGSYTLEVWDDNDVCQTSENIVIEQPELFEVSHHVGEILCAGGQTSISLDITGGVQPYAITWESFNTQSGNWETLSATGISLENVEAGEYRYTVVDARTCGIFIDVVEVEDGSTVDLDFDAPPILCFGGTSQVTLSASSPGSTAFTYYVNGAPIAGNQYLATAGTYVAYAIDNVKGCVSEEVNFTLEQPAAPFAISSFERQSLSCFESEDGELSLTLTGGTGPYTVTFLGQNYSANPNETLVFDGLSANVAYQIEAVDANGCVVDIPPRTLTQPFPLQVESAFNPIQCYAGSTSINLQVSGGTSPYTITWAFSEDGVDPEGIPGTDNQLTLSGVKAGFYHYTVSDGGCEDILRVIEITQPNEVMLMTDKQDVSCFGGNDGSLSFSATGGASGPFRYFVNGQEINDAMLNGLSAGTYTAYAMRGNCISETISLTIDQPEAALSASLDYLNPVLCHGDLSAIQMEISGGTSPYQVALNGETFPVADHSILFQDLAVGQYTLVLTDANGCSWEENLAITGPNPILIEEDEISPVSCFGGEDGEIRVLIEGGNGGYSFEWADSEGIQVGSYQNLVGVPAGVYTLTVTDTNGCINAEDFEILEPTPLSFDHQLTHVSCHGGQNGRIEATAAGGFPGYQLVVNGVYRSGLEATGLSAGTYFIRVADANGCLSPGEEVTITAPEPLGLLVSSENLSCFAANDGRAGVEVTGGTGPYQIRWSDGIQDAERENMAPGNYEVVITDANGCVIRENVLITQPDPINTSVDITPVSCHGGEDGAIQLNLSGGNGNFEIIWSIKDSGEQIGQGNHIQDLTAGVYIATVVDALGCSVEREYVVTEPANPLSLQVLKQDASCYQGDDGSLEVVVAGGTAPYTYQWSTGEQTNRIQGKTMGTYQVEIRDANGCVLIESFDIDEPTPILLEASVTDVSCFGGSDGSINFSPSGGNSSNYRIVLDGQELNSYQVTGLSAGTYAAYAVSQGCRSETINVEVSQPEEALSATLSTQDLLCDGDATGLLVEITGGTAPYVISLDGVDYPVNGSSISLEDLVAGVYEVGVRDAQGCEWSEQVVLEAPSPIEVTEEALIHASCFGAEDGRIEVSISGGVGNYTFQWRDSEGSLVSSSRNLEGVGEGTYTLTVTDNNDCLAEESFVITHPQPISFTYETFPVSCFGGNDGRVEVLATGGTPAYRLLVNGVAQNGLAATGLTAGIYSIQVEDLNGCLSPAEEVEVVSPAPLEMNIIKEDVACYAANDGRAEVQISGGIGPYDIRWSDAGTGQIREGLAPGNFEVVVTDALGCSIRQNIIILQPDPISVNPTITHVSCYGGQDGSISLALSGGNGPFEIRWHKADGGEEAGTGTSLQNLDAGTYVATIADERGCVLEREYVVNEPLAPLQVQPLVMDVRCAGEGRGSVDLIVSGGTAPYTYAWSTGEQTRAVRDKNGGIYQVTITDAKGCSITESIILEEPDPITFDAQIEDVSCYGGSDGSIALEIHGGTGNYQVQWGNGLTGREISGLRAGNYTVFILDGNSCFESHTFRVNEPEAPLQIEGSGNFELCHFDDRLSFEVSVSGGTAPYTYLWSTGETTPNLTDVVPGIYSIQVTDAMGCVLEEEFNIPPPSSPMDISVEGQIALCTNQDRGEVSVTINGGEAPFSYRWSNGATTSTISNLSAGVYTVEVTDARGCWVERSVEIIRPRDLQVSLESIQGVSCAGSNDGALSIAVESFGSPFTVNWSHGVENQLSVSNLSAGTYTVQVADTLGCVTTVAYQVREPAPLAFNETINDVVCHGQNNGSIALEVRGGTAPYSYEWSNGASSRNIGGLSPGSYSVLITDRNGCSTGGQFTVAEPEPLEVLIEHSEMLACHGDENGFIQLTITGGVQPYRVHWADAPGLGTQNRGDLAQGSYTVQVVDDNNCSQTMTIEIQEPERLEAELFTRFEVDCENKVLTGVAWLEINSGEGPFQIYWNNGDRDNLESHFYEDGMVSVMVMNENGCQIELSEVVEMPLAFTDAEFNYTVISTGIQGEILLHEAVQFNDQTLGNVFTWEWDFGDGNKSNEQHPVHSYSRTGTYLVTLTTFDVFGCVSYAQMEIEVVASYRILIPNAFTPNGDGLNDYFRPRMRGIEDYEFHIFNKWGELIYSSYSIEDPGWDGTLNGTMSPNGNYVYKIRYTSIDGEKGSKTGVFTLVL
ncbi:T9SS type B sorting domain-containing protein [Pleomorphovibrio marinus]|uniref:T9SS type B sorting domain-containing protein n=1 Tax=Pleomorphovibrio marinus TaxID=2164132 RepID=UPI000E0A29BF|nr:gliding motility-associated C-terminal domain-containing protein [Pleomorphovibrio marinus]